MSTHSDCRNNENNENNENTIKKRKREPHTGNSFRSNIKTRSMNKHRKDVEMIERYISGNRIRALLIIGFLKSRNCHNVLREIDPAIMKLAE